MPKTECWELVFQICPNNDIVGVVQRMKHPNSVLDQVQHLTMRVFRYLKRQMKNIEEIPGKLKC